MTDPNMTMSPKTNDSEPAAEQAHKDKAAEKSKGGAEAAKPPEDLRCLAKSKAVGERAVNNTLGHGNHFRMQPKSEKAPLTERPSEPPRDFFSKLSEAEQRRAAKRGGIAARDKLGIKGGEKAAVALEGEKFNEYYVLRRQYVENEARRMIEEKDLKTQALVLAGLAPDSGANIDNFIKQLSPDEQAAVASHIKALRGSKHRKKFAPVTDSSDHQRAHAVPGTTELTKIDQPAAQPEDKAIVSRGSQVGLNKAPLEPDAIEDSDEPHEIVKVQPLDIHKDPADVITEGLSHHGERLLEGQKGLPPTPENEVPENHRLPGEVEVPEDHRLPGEVEVVRVPLDPNQQPGDEPPREPQPNHDAERMQVQTIDRTRAIEELATALGNERLENELTANQENAHGLFGRQGRIHNALTQLAKGRVFKGYWQQRYRREEAEKLRQANAKYQAELNSGRMTPAEIAERAKSDSCYALIQRMIEASAHDGDDFLRKTAGERQMKINGESGQQFGEQYREASAAVRNFANGVDDQGNVVKDSGVLEANFRETMARIDAQLHNADGTNGNSAFLSNYEAVARYVKGQVDHLEGAERTERLDELMRNFTIYSSNSVEGVNTQARRSASDRVVERFQHSRLGCVIPSEYVAAAAGIATYATQRAATGAASLVPLIGTMGAAGFFAGAREHNAVATDRATWAQYRATGGENVGGRFAKYNGKMDEAIMEMVPAAGQANVFHEAIESGDANRMAKVLDDWTVRQEFADLNQVDLVSYHSRESVESQRLNLLNGQLQLQTAYINLMRRDDPDFDYVAHRQALLDAVASMQNATDSQRREWLNANGDHINPEVAKLYRQQMQRDRAFSHLQRSRTVKAAFSAAVFSGAVTLAGQEINALFNPNVQGVIEGATGQNTDAQGHTILEGGRRMAANQFGLGQTASAASIPEAMAGTREEAINYKLNDDGSVDFTDASGQAQHMSAEDWSDHLNAMRQSGADVQMHTSNIDQVQQVPASQAVQGNEVVHRTGWYNNYTRVSDNNELTGWSDGSTYFYHPQGTSTGNGLSLTVEQFSQHAQDGQVELWVSPTPGTQAQPYRIVGQVVNGETHFDLNSNPAVAEMMHNNSYAFAEVVDRTNNMVLATEVGSGTATTLPTTVSVSTVTGATIMEQVANEVTAPSTGVPTDQLVMPAPLASATRRRGLGTRRSEETPSASAASPVSPSSVSAGGRRASSEQSGQTVAPTSGERLIPIPTIENREASEMSRDDIIDSTNELMNLVQSKGSENLSAILDRLDAHDMFDVADGQIRLNDLGQRVIGDQQNFQRIYQAVANDPANSGASRARLRLLTCERLIGEYRGQQSRQAEQPNEPADNEAREAESTAQSVESTAANGAESVQGAESQPVAANGGESAERELSDNEDESNTPDWAMGKGTIADWQDKLTSPSTSDEERRSMIERENRYLIRTADGGQGETVDQWFNAEPYRRELFTTNPSGELVMSNLGYKYLQLNRDDLTERSDRNPGDTINGTYTVNKPRIESFEEQYWRARDTYNSIIEKRLNDLAYDEGWSAEQYNDRLGEAKGLFVRKDGPNSSLILNDAGKAAVSKMFTDNLLNDKHAPNGQTAFEMLINGYNNGQYR